MNRNVESRFAQLPSIHIERSTFDMSHDIKTTFNVGDVVPLDVLEVLPGDTFDVTTSKVCRLQTPLTPFMDNIYLDTYWFFVPSRLLWSHWKEFNGENTQSAWIPTTEYTVPTITAPSGGFSVGTIADYMGIPTGVSGLEVSSLPFRAYALIMNEWFRDQNLTDPLQIPVDDTNRTGSNGGNYITDVVLGGKPFKAAKYHDYFTSCLPAPQKGPNVPLPVTSVSGGGLAPVTTGAVMSSLPTVAMKLVNTSTGTTPTWGSGNFMALTGDPGSVGLSPVSGDAYRGTAQPVAPSNLYADLSQAGFDLNVGTINDLRIAFQTQKFYEKLARQGSRYTEILRGMFGVESPDSRLQRPEYLGGNRLDLKVNQVVQTSGTMSGTTAQGTTTAFSLTSDVHSDFFHSFTEHGYVIGLMVARYDHNYQQGLNRMWSRKNRFDYYWPVFANIGEQAVKNKEIFAQGPSAINPDTNKPYDDEVFGYNEAWADYRFRPNIVTGEMRSSYEQSLDVWHLGDDYESLPSLSDSWIREDKTNVDRVLSVTSSVSNQLFGDIFVKCKATRPMPMFSIPGLIDHN